MDEALLHFIWKFSLFDTQELVTQQGEPLQILFRGEHNTDAGPDFENARICIGDTIWAGHVELHVRASDWFRHRHSTDAAFDNVILHVVYDDDGKSITRPSGEVVPVLELRSRIRTDTIMRYRQLLEGRKQIPCAPFFASTGEQCLSGWLTRLTIERLEQKVDRILTMLHDSRGDWENTAFRLVARYLGASVNQDPFDRLARSLPVTLWARHSHDRLQIEALLFGQAGWLDEEWEEDYPRQLRKEYLYLKRLHGLTPLPAHAWKLLRLRPSNFPTLRMAQLAALLTRHTNLFATLLEAKDTKTLQRFFEVEVSAYWQSHYVFGKRSTSVRSSLGAAMVNILLINAVAPLLFSYGRYKGEQACCERAVQLLESLPPESNAVIRQWASLGVQPAHAFETQALLQLRHSYCDQFRCLSCAVGLQILK